MELKNIVRQLLGVLLILSVFGLVGCSSGRSQKTEVTEVVYETYQLRQPPGVVEYIWEEPMVDVIDVPPGLDPDGIYYRPGHQEIVEIRQGRWQYYKKPQK